MINLPILEFIFSFFKYILRRFLFWILVLLSIITMLISHYKKDLFIEPIMDSFSFGMAPFEESMSKIRKYTNDIYDLFNVHGQNKLLKQEIERLRLIDLEAELLKVENGKLKEILDFVPQKLFEYKTAKLVSISVGPYANTGIIAAGYEDDIQQNHVLLGTRGVIGRVMNVAKNSSKILFITDINSKIPIMAVNSRERGIIAGNNSESLDLLYINKNSKITIGELVVTSGDGKFYPAGLPVGRVKSIENGNITVEPFLELYQLEYLSILKYKK